MKKTVIAIVMLGVSSGVIAAQATAPAAADTAAADSTKVKDPTSRKWEVRLGGFMVSGERNAALNSTISHSTGSVKGVEVLLRGTGGGIMVRSSASTFGKPPDVINADASVILGPPAFSIFVGGGKRGVTSTLATNVYTFARAGLQMTFGIGGTGLRAQFGGWAFAPIPADKKRMDLSGEGEASILYSPPRIPLFVQVGYRNEVFKTKTTSASTPEEVRGLRVAAGIQFGGK